MRFADWWSTADERRREIAPRPRDGGAEWPSSYPLIRVLEVDRDLLEGCPNEQEAIVAQRHAVARLQAVRPGPWDAAADMRDAGSGFLGCLVIEGMLCRRIGLGDHATVELLGAGDVLSPADDHPHATYADTTADWTVLSHTQLALLDRDFTAIAARWPWLVASLTRRVSQRVRSLTLQLTISHVTGVDARVLLMLSHLSERWGRVTPNGVLVPVRLTNETIGALIGARRPSVSAALTRLTRSGAVERCSDGTWLLHAQPDVSRDGAAGTVPAVAAGG